MRVLHLVMAFSVFPFGAAGGPCHGCFTEPGSGPLYGFWDERNVSNSPGFSCDPDIAAGIGAIPDDIGPLVIVWSDDTTDPPAVNPEGDLEIWLAVSTNGGCSFTNFQLTANNVDDEKPTVCLNFELDFAEVAFVNQAGVSVILVSRVSNVPAFSSPETLNANPLVSDFRSVDVACAPEGRSDVYASWDAAVTVGPSTDREVFFKRNRMAGAPGSWEGSDGGPAETSLTAAAGLADSNSTEPSLSSDVYTSVPGGSSVSVLFINDGHCGNAGSCVMFLRSRDGGATFFGDPMAFDPAPVAISDTAAGVTVSKVEADSSLLGFAGTSPKWYNGVWIESGAGMGMDAQAENVAGYDQPWNVPPQTDIHLPSSAGMQIVDAATGLEFSYFPDSVSVEWMWTAVGPTGSEIFWDHGILWVPGFGYDKFEPFCLNGPFRITGQNPPRASGGADSVSLDIAYAGMFMAFRDDRDGGSEIYFKRSDHRMRNDEVGNVTATPLDCPEVGFALTWDHATRCPADHYRVYYTAIGVDDWFEVAAPPVVINNLDAYKTYYYHVTAVNEACYESLFTEQSIQMDTCDYVLRSRGTLREDHCPFGYGDGNFKLEPGERVSNVRIQVDNQGRIPVTNCTATLVSRMAEVTVLPPALSRYPEIGGAAVRNETAFEFDLGRDFQCGTTLEFNLEFACDQGAFTVPVEVTTTKTPCEICKGCDALPGEIQNLQVVRTGNDIQLSWGPDSLAINGYNVWVVSNETDIPRATMADRSPSGPANPVPGCAAPGPAVTENCLFASGVTDPAPLLFFQVKGFCSGQEGP